MAKLSHIPHIKQAYSFEDAVTMTGFGRYNLNILFTVGGFLMCVIIETMSMMFIAPAAQCDLNLTLGEKGLLSSITFFGVVACSLIWGFMADTRGRKNIVILSLFSSAVVSFISSMITSSWLFILLRFINGCCIGGASSITYAYAGEFHNNVYRPKMVSWLATFVAFGNMYLPSLAWVILPQSWNYYIPFLNLYFRPWRLLIIIYALPSIIFSICLCFLPESPKFLLTQGKHEEVLVILKKMFVTNTGKSENDYLVTGIIWDDLSDNVPYKHHGFLATVWRQIAPLFKRPLLLKTIMVCLLQFGIFGSTSGMIMWYPELLNKMSSYIIQTNSSDVSLCRAINQDSLFPEFTKDGLNSTICLDTVDLGVFPVILVVGGISALLYFLIGTFINIIGKKTLLIGFIVVTTAAGLAAQLVNGYSWIQILVGAFVSGGVEVGIVNAIVVDLYPTQIRGMAVAISLMIGRFGAMAGTNLVGPLLYNFCDYLFYIFTTNHVVLVIIVLLLPSSPHLEKMIHVIS